MRRNPALSQNCRQCSGILFIIPSPLFHVNPCDSPMIMCFDVWTRANQCGNGRFSNAFGTLAVTRDQGYATARCIILFHHQRTSDERPNGSFRCDRFFLRSFSRSRMEVSSNSFKSIFSELAFRLEASLSFSITDSPSVMVEPDWDMDVSDESCGWLRNTSLMEMLPSSEA